MCDPVNYSSVVDTGRIDTTASKVSIVNFQQIPFGQSQYPCAVTLPFIYTVISVVSMHLITFQEPTTRTYATV